ncbi:MAG: Dam family site-specific DNA-(adenine-N6)-methyltransferase [Terriglobia bacterium]|jgi:DNA adenine methylase
MEFAIPFLKWAGGKRWFVNQHLDGIPAYKGRYFEPFLGSGAVFFGVRPSRAILADLNPDLIATFSAIKQNWRGVEALLRKYHQLHSKPFYYMMRKSRPRSPIVRAARFIYLNRTCWNGLYRVNVSGQFNVPIGTKESVVLETDDFDQVSRLLKHASLVVSDFKRVIRRARKGDFIFADPPYVTSHSNNGFLKYNENLFGWDDQVRLRDCLLQAKKNGAHVLSTNADTPPIRKLYKKDFTIRSVTRPSVIAAGSDKRGMVRELIITSW